MSALFPLFLKLAGRRVLLVGGGPVAASKLRGLLDAGADVHVVAPSVIDDIARAAVTVERRRFAASDLDGVWLVVAAATPEANREVAAAAEARGIFVNAVDDMQNASAYLGGVLRRDGVTVAISTDGAAPALAGLLREGLDALLPRDLDAWMTRAHEARRDWLERRVPMAERRPLLLDALVRLYEEKSATPSPPAPQLTNPPARRQGFVALVGAGPGDPDLLTRRAAQRLAEADVVFYDALVDLRALALAPRARRVFVGKRAGRPAVRQEFINRALVRAAQRGMHVVRLKGGDPFVFGRGGEEALALTAAGVPFEVVPGISAAIAAPALAGIPVTHRGVAPAFVVVSGHAEAAYRPALESLAPGSATIVVLMGLAHGRAIASLLITRGWNPATPVAVIMGAATEAATAQTLTLADLSPAREPASEQSPARKGPAYGPVGRGFMPRQDPGPGTIVIGDVVRLRGVLAASQLNGTTYDDTGTEHVRAHAALVRERT